MDRRRKLSVSSDDSSASDRSSDPPRPSFNCDGNEPEEILQWKLQTVDSFKRTIEELKSEYDRHLPTLTKQIKKLNDIADEIESVHKKATVVSLAGVSVGGVGGITALAGLALAPFTLGASLSLTAVGVVAGAAGVTSVASAITNILKQRKLRLTVVKIICDFLETIKPMTEPLSIISFITEDIQQNNEILSKLQFQTPVRGFDDLFNTAKAADVALVGKNCAEASKEICVYEKAVRAVCDPAKAARATGVLSSMFLALDVVSNVQNSIEIAEMNQPAKARKPKRIISRTRKFIHYTRQTASQFQKTLDKIKYVINTIN